jgi:hypothetical protein
MRPKCCSTSTAVFGVLNESGIDWYEELVYINNEDRDIHNVVTQLC